MPCAGLKSHILHLACGSHDNWTIEPASMCRAWVTTPEFVELEQGLAHLSRAGIYSTGRCLICLQAGISHSYWCPLLVHCGHCSWASSASCKSRASLIFLPFSLSPSFTMPKTSWPIPNLVLCGFSIPILSPCSRMLCLLDSSLPIFSSRAFPRSTEAAP